MADIIAAHRHRARHRKEIEASTQCACFYCLNHFAPAKIVKWIDDGQTALCPFCPVDSVIGDASGYPVTDPAFLAAIHEHWFKS